MGMANPIPADAPVLVNMAVLIPIKLPEESWNGTRTYDMGSNGSIEPRSDTNDACMHRVSEMYIINTRRGPPLFPGLIAASKGNELMASVA